MGGEGFNESTTLLKSAEAFANAIIAMDGTYLTFAHSYHKVWKRLLPRVGVLALVLSRKPRFV